MQLTKTSEPIQALSAQNCVNAIGEALHGKRNGKNGFDSCDCPVHGGHECLSVDVGDTGAITIYCHTCGKDGTPAIIEALKQMGLWPDSPLPSFALSPEQAEARRREKAQDQARDHKAAMQEMRQVYKKATSEGVRDHGYLKKKGIAWPVGLRHGTFPGLRGDILMVPYRQTINGDIVTVQGISPDGEIKLFFKDCPFKDSFYHIPAPEGYSPSVLYMGEGLATVYAITDETVYGKGIGIVAGNAGNMVVIARRIRKPDSEGGIFPDGWKGKIILLADEDPAGLKAAEKAARECGGKVARPQAVLDTEAPKGYDFWDLRREYGEKAVNQALAKAVSPESAKDEKKETPPLGGEGDLPGNPAIAEMELHTTGFLQNSQLQTGETPMKKETLNDTTLGNVPADVDMPQNAPETAQNAQTPEGEREALLEALNREVGRLAGLPEDEYELQRKDAAKALGVRPTFLDKKVESMRADATGGQDLPIEETVPWPEPVDPAALLDEIEATVGRFIVCSPEVRTAATLWAAFTWFIDAVKIAPIALITAPEKGCGKTQMLVVLKRLSYHSLSTSNLTSAVLFRIIEMYHPTLMIDEADAFMRDNEELRGLINSGYDSEDQRVWRVGDDEARSLQGFRVWGAKAIAGIKAEKLASTITDRSIVLSMRRRLKTEKVERLRRADPALFPSLRQKLARFAQDASETVREQAAELEDLEALGDRQLDNWEPLRAIAEVAGKHWPQKVKEAALALSGKANDEPDGIGPELLSNIWTIFQYRSNQDRMTTKDLIDALKSEEEWRWKTYNRGLEITFRQLAQLLKPYEIHSRNMKVNGEVFKGYFRSDFEDAVSRYLPSETPLTKSIPPDSPHFIRYPLLSNKIKALGGFSSATFPATPQGVADVQEAVAGAVADKVADKKYHNSLNIQESSGVADKTPPSPQYLFPDTDFEGNSYTQNTNEEDDSWAETM